ncbi:chromosome segregation protein SMC [archaeon]
MGKIEKIKMKDFKSFRNVIIPFVDGFTSVVGPNGSGKSNLNDAIMFVLGEGSMKSLRAGRLTDLVHHSSKSGEAEVVIDLRDNKEKYTVSRSIDKKGSSVYRLNGKRTTKTDVIELLNSMSIPPEGYNIIMQGDVMSIINMTPKQRREYIDDISGIAEYNQKKDKAMRELEKVEEKIKEANIILYERGGYLKEIKKERDEALRYKRFDEDRKQLKHSIIYSELTEVEANYKESSEKVATLRKDLDELQDNLKKVSAQITNWENQLKALQQEIMDKGADDQRDISREIEQLKSKLSITQEKIKNRREDITAAKAEIEKAKRLIEEGRAEAGEKKEALKKLKEEDDAYAARIKEKGGELEAYMAELREKNLLVGDITKKLEDMNDDIAKKKELFYEVKGRLDQIREKISVKKLSMSDRGVEREESDKRIDELKEAFDTVNHQFAEQKRRFKGHEQELEQMFAQEKALNKEYSEVDSELDAVREKYHSLQSKVTTIRHMTGNTASDSVMKAKDELPGVIGTVEELCSFDVEYATAIQTAAGARMHFIVTKDSAAATNAIKWLKRKKLGRTTFIPLDRIRPIEISQQAENAMRNPKAIDFAIKLVKFKKEHHNVFSYVFGDTVVVENIDAAKEIGFGTCRMATMDGDLAEASGAVTGGFKRGSLTLQEIKNVDELKEKSEKLQKKQEKLMRGLEELREKMNYSRSQKAEAELKAAESEVRVNELQQRMDDHRTMTKKYSLSAEDIEKEIASMKTELIENEKKMKELQADIHEAEEKKELAKEKIDSPESRVVSQRLEEMQKRVQSLRDQRAEVMIQINSINAELDKYMGEREKARLEAVKENEDLIKEWAEQVKSLEKDDKEAQVVLKEKLVQEKEISSSIRGLVERRDSLEGEVRKLAEQRGQLQRQSESKQSLFNDENFKKAKWETRLTDLKAEFDEEAPVKDFKMSIDEMKEEVENLRNKMIRLEPINLAAVEKYDKYVAELDVMKDKANKLGEEKESVLALMEEIESHRKEAFMEAFSEIRNHLNKIYKRFYPETEAYADISLQNEAEPFEGGLLIEARPAGKQMKIIDAMSGGEKTLAALAFLFAVQEYKPSPFYILDEADAALDKPNSERLAHMIQTRTGDSQFIVITHNNPMIHVSDQIVGVSMNKEKGSSIVEVDLKRLEASDALSLK